MAKQRRSDPKLTVEERTALVLAPVGTPGLAELGLTDEDFSDLDDLGPRAQTAAAELWGTYRAQRALEHVEKAVEAMRPLTDEQRARLLAALEAAI